MIVKPKLVLALGRTAIICLTSVRYFIYCKRGIDCGLKYNGLK